MIVGQGGRQQRTGARDRRGEWLDRAWCVLLAAALLALDGEPGLGQTLSMDTTDGGGAGAASEIALAVRAVEAPDVDGRLDEAVWSSARPLDGFVQREPNEGEPAPYATEVRFVYTEEALYVGARMAADPGTVRADVTRRDDTGNAERLVVSLDTYLDRRTAYTFVVTAAGTRVDWYHASDSENAQDYSFDPVWEAATRLDADGWTAELRIPFSQLRFSRSPEQVWGVNVVRVREAQQEETFWRLVGREQAGWASRMGELRGLEGIGGARRIELRPYVASSATLASGIDGDDPFARERSASVRAGGELKMGLGPNLTLDATVNPDFGQVEADPAVVNLSAFEVFFEERRPFFTEGARLFDFGDLFYSRRIGARPHGDPDADYVEDLDNTTILGAAKLTGRLPSGLSLGVLGAVTEREEVSTYDVEADRYGRAVVEPLTGYGVARVDQQFGADGSNVGAILTAVHRGLDGQPELASILNRSAVTGGLGGRFRWAGGMYDVNWRLSATHVAGSEEAMLRQQRSSRRYYQRPDADHLELDPTRTSLTGYAISVGHSRNSGDHWLWDVDMWAESPGFEPNDLGRLSRADGIGGFGGLTYRETTPGRLFRNYAARIMHEREVDYGGTLTSAWYGLNLRGRLANFWYTEFGVDYVPPTQSPTLTRGGPLMKGTGFRGLFAGTNTPSGKRFQLGLWGGGGDDFEGGWNYWVSPELSYQPSARLELSFEPELERSMETRQYVDDFDGGPAATYGTRYVFSSLDYTELAARMRLNYAIGPDLTLETYLEPFVSTGDYHGFGELEAARGNDLLRYGARGTTLERQQDGDYRVTDGDDSFVIGDPDFHVRSFRSNVVLRWEWRPGSTLFLVWQQDRSEDGPAGRTARPGDLWEGVRAEGDDFFAVKVAYWLPL